MNHLFWKCQPINSCQFHFSERNANTKNKENTRNKKQF
uniref:Uncharacterized protein n=1 Tax=Rhizophora mucronata TaxID=61149 RepID=A0A2P2QJH8_RHIMU